MAYNSLHVSLRNGVEPFAANRGIHEQPRLHRRQSRCQSAVGGLMCAEQIGSNSRDDCFAD